MRDPAILRVLPDGRRLHFHDGPIDLILQAEGPHAAVKRAYDAAAARFVHILDELCAELPLLRSQCLPDSPQPSGPIAQGMLAAVAPYSTRCFITPMAAVAGAVAEAVLGEMTRAGELHRAFVNNGGDIAIHLASSRSYTVGMIERPDKPSLLGWIRVNFDSPIRGIATSGWRGRSFSLGIVDAVTVLAASAAEADAAATVIANAVDLPGHSAILRVPANQIAPDSDLGEIPVTRGVAALTPSEMDKALENGTRVAEELRANHLIYSAALSLQGQVRVLSSLSNPVLKQRDRVAPDRLTDVSPRSVLHA